MFSDVRLLAGIRLSASKSLTYTRRFQSVWMGIIVHSAQSVFVFFVILSFVLA